MANAIQNNINFSAINTPAASQNIPMQRVANSLSSISSLQNESCCSSIFNGIKNWFKSIGEWFQKHWHAYQLNSGIKEGKRQIQDILESDRGRTFFQRYDFWQDFPDGQFKAIIIFRTGDYKHNQAPNVIGVHCNIVDRNQLIGSFREVSLQKLEESCRSAAARDPKIFSNRVTSVQLLVMGNRVDEQGRFDVFQAQSGGGKKYPNVTLDRMAAWNMGIWTNEDHRRLVQEFVIR